MRIKLFIIAFLVNICAAAQVFDLQSILDDIYNQLSEQGDVPAENFTEEMMDIAANPINLNQTSEEEFRTLCWLTSEQIDEILMYGYLHQYQSIYELQLINSLKDYDIRNLLPFVYVGDKEEDKHIYFRDIFYYAKHEITLRADARNIEDFDQDPMYAKLRYRFNYNNRVQAGLTVGRPTGANLREMEYGGYVQLQDIGHIKSMTVGDFQANFGQGLVIGNPFHMGKNSYVSSGINTKEGVRKFTSVGSGYSNFHGIGTTLRFDWAEVSALYSLQQTKNDAWHHVVGTNVTGKWKKLKVGLTAIENIYSDETAQQAVMGINARYNWGKVDLWGEMATTQGEKWGWGGIAGLRFTPWSDVIFLALYRHYSADFHNPFGYAFSEKTKLNNETGGYLGVDVRCLKKWRFTGYADIYRGGYDATVYAYFMPTTTYDMNWRVRSRGQQDKDTYSLRYQFNYYLGSWKFRTQADANMVKTDGWNYGISLLQDIEYQVPTIPIVLQLRVQAFDAREWNNRVYIYENDVLYAYAIPFVYGLGGRFWLNARYKINDIFSVYLRISETVYQEKWAITHDRKNTRTDVHALLRVKL